MKALDSGFLDALHLILISRAFVAISPAKLKLFPTRKKHAVVLQAYRLAFAENAIIEDASRNDHGELIAAQRAG